jgi:hypothetical protein
MKFGIRALDIVASNIYVFHIQWPMLGRIYYMSANGITLTHIVRRQDILEVKKIPW